MRSLGRDDGWKNHGWHHLMMRCLFFTFFGSPKSNIWKYVRNMEMWLGSSEIFSSFTKFPFIASQRQSHGCVPCKWWSASEWRPQHQPEEFFQGYTMTCLNFSIAFRTHDEMSMQNTTRWWVFAIQYSTPKLFFLQTLPGSSYRGTKITRPDNLKLCVRNISLVKAIHSNKWNNIQPNR